eukprot:gnl/MRDRNA2_/MRDRNA2_121863_c0_seq1.p1 gnl/MRDRNA2_/MRDRNA2_121863_c0~~gnl/MRDRNA2_/MRDRNA2_121863_c0_seq1.p1  ORF type:complete len:267 (+),score=32.71 gnl/MRDRNA2_/MRDRNA2_121863_c0_seq1:106-906(+)
MTTVDLSGGGGGGGYSAPAPSGGGYQPPSGPGASGGLGWQGQLGQQLVQNAISDPATQNQMKAAAADGMSRGYAVAKEGAAQAYTELHKYIQEGPAGVSILCFLGGLATTIVGILGLLSIFSIILSPFHYILNAYLTLFGVVAVLLEADVDRLHKMTVANKLAPIVQEYQFKVFEHAKFLTELRGRGFFYLFVGTLAISQCFFCLLFLCGAWNVLMGVLCLLMSYGVNPSHLAGDAADVHHHEQGYEPELPPPQMQQHYAHVSLAP